MKNKIGTVNQKLLKKFNFKRKWSLDKSAYWWELEVKLKPFPVILFILVQMDLDYFWMGVRTGTHTVENKYKINKKGNFEKACRELIVYKNYVTENQIKTF